MTNDEIANELLDIITRAEENLDDPFSAVLSNREISVLREAHSSLCDNGWISSYDHLPEESGMHIVYIQAPEDMECDWSFVTDMFYDDGQKIWRGDGGSYNACLSIVHRPSEYAVTHWRTMPAPPADTIKETIEWEF